MNHVSGVSRMNTADTFLMVQEYRIYPNYKQRNYIDRTLGCTRVVYNQLLAQSDKDYEQWKYRTIAEPELKRPSVTGYSLVNRLPTLKERLEFLKDVNAIALQQSALDLGSAFSEFFKGISGYPKFKKRRSGGAFRLVGNSFKIINGTHVKLAKLDKPIRLVLTSRTLPERVSSINVVRKPSGEYYIQLKGEMVQPKTEGLGFVGVDLGLTDVIVDSNGGKVTNPKHFERSQARLRRIQQSLSRKTKGSNNYNRTRIKVAKVQQRIANQRKDLLHVNSRKLVNENQVIVIENLNVKGLLKNRNLGKHIGRVGWGEFRRQLEYKAKWSQHCSVIIANRYFSSSKLCSNCHTKNDNLKLNQRMWTCTVCHTEHDRDINAAINLRQLGLKFPNLYQHRGQLLLVTDNVEL